jgi:hypothetical protein
LERAAVGLDDLRVALVKEHEGPLDAADVDGLPETIQHEDVVAQDRFHWIPFIIEDSPRQVERVVVTLGKIVSNSVNNCQSESRYIAVTKLFLKPVILVEESVRLVAAARPATAT